MIDKAELLPHYEVIPQGVSFLGRQRIALSVEQIEVIQSVIDDRSCIANFSTRQSEIFHDLERRAIVTRYVTPPPPCESTLLVVSPHRDDAAFSVGGCLFLNRSEFAIRIVNVFTQDYFSIFRWLRNERDRLIDLREAEESLLARVLGCEIVDFDFVDAAERQTTDAGIIRRIESRLRQCMTPDVSICLVPSGIGHHPDHLICRGVAERVAKEFPDIRFLYYEDQPYASQGEHQRTSNGLEHLVDVTSVIDQKRNLVSLYQTQIARGEIQKVLRYMQDSNKPSPRFFESLTEMRSVESTFVNRPIENH